MSASDISGKGRVNVAIACFGRSDLFLVLAVSWPQPNDAVEISPCPGYTTSQVNHHDTAQ